MKNSVETIMVDFHTEWKKLTRHAVTEFVTSAVVIDDSPKLHREKDAEVGEGDSIMANAIDEGLGDGMDEDQDASAKENLGTEGSDSNEDFLVADQNEKNMDHTIYIQDMTNAFRKSNIPCSFILPDGNEDDSEIVKDIVNAANLADILILDWHLKGKSPLLQRKRYVKLQNWMHGKMDGYA